MAGEIGTLDDFRQRLREGVGVIVNTDVAQATPVAHAASGCSWLKEQYFVQKVIEGGGRNGRYYWLESFESAKQWGARPCSRCGRQADTPEGASVTSRGAAVRPPTPLKREPTVSDVVADEVPLPFPSYRERGRVLLGPPPWGDGSARSPRGYGFAVVGDCGPACAYCGRDLSANYEAWLHLSVEHVIPQQLVAQGFPREWIDDRINLVIACRACNEFLNAYRVDEAAPVDLDGFCELRNRHFRIKAELARRRHERERAVYEQWRSLLPTAPAAPVKPDETGRVEIC